MATKQDKYSAFFKSYKSADEQLDFKMAHEVVGEKVEAFSTGSLSLDEALSSGGIPEGRIIQYYGKGGSGKSLMSMIAIKNAQKKDPNADQVFIDAEGTFDADWAESLGVDTTRVILVEDDTAVNARLCFTMLLGVPKEDAKHILSGQAKEGLLDKIQKKEMNINLIVLDSLGAVQPPGEDTSVVGKSNMALMARFISTTFRKLSLALKKAKVPFIIINHIRDSFDQYGATHSYSGGRALTHFLSANVFFELVQRKDASILDDNENKIGGTIKAKVEKTKFGPWPRTCEYKIDFSKGVVDQHEEVGQLALDYGIVTKPTTMSYEYEELKWVGMPKYLEAIKSDKSLLNKLVEEIGHHREKKLEDARNKQAQMRNRGTEDIEEGDSALAKILEEDFKTDTKVDVEKDSEADVKVRKQKKVKQ